MIQGLVGALQAAGTAGIQSLSSGLSSLQGMGANLADAKADFGEALTSGIENSALGQSKFGNFMGYNDLGSKKLKPLPTLLGDDGMSSFLSVSRNLNVANPSVGMIGDATGSLTPIVEEMPLLRQNNISFQDVLDQQRKKDVAEALAEDMSQDKKFTTPKLLQPDNANNQGVLYENLF